jgi:hypothetical protein
MLPRQFDRDPLVMRGGMEAAAFGAAAKVGELFERAAVGYRLQSAFLYRSLRPLPSLATLPSVAR